MSAEVEEIDLTQSPEVDEINHLLPAPALCTTQTSNGSGVTDYWVLVPLNSGALRNLNRNSNSQQRQKGTNKKGGKG